MLDILTFDEAEWGQTDVTTEVMKGGNGHVTKIQLIHQLLFAAVQKTFGPNLLFCTLSYVDSLIKQSTSVNSQLCARLHACTRVHPVWITYCGSN